MEYVQDLEEFKILSGLKEAENKPGIGFEQHWRQRGFELIKDTLNIKRISDRKIFDLNDPELYKELGNQRREKMIKNGQIDFIEKEDGTIKNIKNGNVYKNFNHFVEANFPKDLEINKEHERIYDVDITKIKTLYDAHLINKE